MTDVSEARDKVMSYSREFNSPFVLISPSEYLIAVQELIDAVREEATALTLQEVEAAVEKAQSLQFVKDYLTVRKTMGGEFK